ncbi:hypothetical protein [Brevibacillus sp. SYP-B805]|nr:hypothetical protein [Brevibacillus sp. SYP-B805]
MGKQSNNGSRDDHIRHGGDAHRSTRKPPEGPVQGFSQAPKGLQ